MANVINHNISAFNTLRNLNKSNSSLSSSLSKLSSGFRINTGKDGPADLVISEKLRAQTVGLERAVRNTQEAQNVIGIAEGALNEMNEILKTMRGLALHAANNGITSPEQVAADQSEVDSAIQTIDRIANTTKYSDQFLLNGNKGIVYDRSTVVDGTQQNSLLNTSSTTLQQIFKRDDFELGITFTGATGTLTNGSGTADVKQEARKAYFEVDSTNTNNDVNGTNIDKAQDFIITGDKGSRAFSFDAGASLGQINSAISNVSSSTGVDSSLIFASNMTSDATITAATAANAARNIGGDDVAVANVRVAGDMGVFDNVGAGGNPIVTSIGVDPTGILMGKNTDGEGKIYLKVTGDTTYELYKDSSLSKESLVGHGVSGANDVIADNNSGLGAMQLALTGANNHGEVVVLAMNGFEGGNAGMNQTGSFASAITDATFDSDLTSVYGVRLGQNTDAEGKIYTRVVMETATTGQVFAYKDSQMRQEDLVAQSESGLTLGWNGGSTNVSNVMLNAVKSDDGTADTGLYMSLTVAGGGAGDDGFAGAAGDTHDGVISFDRLGIRISSDEYGADEFVQIQQNTGSIFQYYDQADSNTATLVDAGVSGQTVRQEGQNATLSVNGATVETDGLSLNLATQDVSGELVFNAGKVGSTTIAQVGYTEGNFNSRAGMLTDTSLAGNAGSFLTNAGHVTSERLGSFAGGMQFQLGEGAGDQERTVYGIQSMAVANLGLTQFTDVFDDTKAVEETKTLSLQDVLGGGLASLGVDPVKALEIIDQAIDDVSTLRARLGATQKNLLQTNANSLNVAIENIMATESDIRDANMAKETTDFTKNQILVQAGTAMLAQANSLSQNVLSLLG